MNGGRLGRMNKLLQFDSASQKRQKLSANGFNAFTRKLPPIANEWRIDIEFSRFWRASSQLFMLTSTFTMKGLSDFLKSGPVTLLPEIYIEEIVFLEPLQGKRRTIPIRFVESYEVRSTLRI
jgi:hypothetical protein